MQKNTDEQRIPRVILHNPCLKVFGLDSNF